MRYSVVALLLLAGLLLAAGCATTPPANTTATPTKTTVAPPATTVQPATYTLNDSGKTVPLGLNQTLNVSLRENPSTGYSWNATVSTGLVIVNSEYTADPAGAGMAGAGGTRVWTVRGAQAGTQRFDAVYVRPWEPNLAAEKFNLTVQVG